PHSRDIASMMTRHSRVHSVTVRATLRCEGSPASAGRGLTTMRLRTLSPQSTILFMAALMAGCPDDGTSATTLSDESSSESGGSNTNSTVTNATTVTGADSTSESSDTDNTTLTTSDTVTDTVTDTSEGSTSTDAESSSSGGGPACGDGVADPGEDCDGTDLAG